MKRFAIFSLIFVNYTLAVKFLPILIWHGAAGTCCDKETLQYAKILKSHLGDDVYIKSVRIGSTTDQDKVLSLFTHPFSQIKQVCEDIKNDYNFKNGYNGIGLSQGGLFIRGLLQNCDGPQMRNLISLGGPQQGVFDYPHCEETFRQLCSVVQLVITKLVYSGESQDAVAPATYWHDPEHPEKYRKSSTFLSIINNEKIVNSTYIERVKKLKNLVLVKYVDDGTIVPNESTHFGFVSKKEAIELKDMDIYKKDRLGLRHLDERGSLILLESPGTHLELFEPWFVENLIKYFK